MWGIDAGLGVQPAPSQSFQLAGYQKRNLIFCHASHNVDIPISCTFPWKFCFPKDSMMNTKKRLLTGPQRPYLVWEFSLRKVAAGGE